MEAIKKNQKAPLFHIVKRDNISTSKKIFIKAVAILCAFLVSSIFVAIAEGADPGTLFISFFQGTFGNMAKFWNMLKELSILLGLSLALLPAFKMKFWNTGADGQALVGAMAAYLVMYFMQGNNDVVIVIVSLLAAVVSGIIWAVIPAIFKACFNTNETLFTLMMNYIAIQLVSYFVNTYGKDNKLAMMADGRLGMIYKCLTAVIIVTLVFVFVTVYLKRSKHGYELSIVGESQATARYAGINVKWVIIRTMILSGAICGLVGFVLTNGFNYCVSTTTLNGRGFTAIIITWLAAFNPYYMILASFFVVFIQKGGSQFLTNIVCTNSAITNVMTGIFFFFIIGCTFFSDYRIMVRKDENDDVDNKYLKPVVHAYIKCENFFAGLLNKMKKTKKTEEVTEAESVPVTEEKTESVTEEVTAKENPVTENKVSEETEKKEVNE